MYSSIYLWDSSLYTMWIWETAAPEIVSVFYLWRKLLYVNLAYFSSAFNLVRLGAKSSLKWIKQSDLNKHASPLYSILFAFKWFSGSGASEINPCIKHFVLIQIYVSQFSEVLESLVEFHDRRYTWAPFNMLLPLLKPSSTFQRIHTQLELCSISQCDKNTMHKSTFWLVSSLFPLTRFSESCIFPNLTCVWSPFKGNFTSDDILPECKVPTLSLAFT